MFAFISDHSEDQKWMTSHTAVEKRRQLPLG